MLTATAVLLHSVEHLTCLETMGIGKASGRRASEGLDGGNAVHSTGIRQTFPEPILRAMQQHTKIAAVHVANAADFVFFALLDKYQLQNFAVFRGEPVEELAYASLPLLTHQIFFRVGIQCLRFY